MLFFLFVFLPNSYIYVFILQSYVCTVSQWSNPMSDPALVSRAMKQDHVLIEHNFQFLYIIELYIHLIIVILKKSEQFYT